MIYNFKTEEDDQQWVVDTELLTWARASSIIAAPTIIAAEANIARFVPTEEGKLIPLGGGRYNLEGRQPFDENHKPQLSLFMIITVLSTENEGTCMTFFQANVAAKGVQHQNIKNFESRCLPPMQLENKA